MPSSPVNVEYRKRLVGTVNVIVACWSGELVVVVVLPVTVEVVVVVVHVPAV